MSKRTYERKTGTWRPWSDEEDDRLKEAAGKISFTKLGKELGRSRGSVAGRADRLGVSFSGW